MYLQAEVVCTILQKVLLFSCMLNFMNLLIMEAAKPAEPVNYRDVSKYFTSHKRLFVNEYISLEISANSAIFMFKRL